MTIFYAASHIGELSPQELHALYKLRVDVFVHEQQCPYQEIDDVDALDSTTHILVWRTDPQRHLVGCARVYPDGDHIMMGRIITAPAERGSGQASDMIRQTLRMIEHRYPGMPVELHAQTRLVGFYERFGFRVSGEPFDEEGISHTPMRRLPDAPQ